MTDIDLAALATDAERVHDAVATVKWWARGVLVGAGGAGCPRAIGAGVERGRARARAHAGHGGDAGRDGSRDEGSGVMAMEWPRWCWSPEEMDGLLHERGLEASYVEWEARLRRDRFRELAEHGWSPFLWEFKRIADVIGMDMTDLFDRVMEEEG